MNGSNHDHFQNTIIYLQENGLFSEGAGGKAGRKAGRLPGKPNLVILIPYLCTMVFSLVNKKF